MKKIIFIILSGLILSCNSAEKLEGNWIGAYTYAEETESSMNLPLRVFINFEDHAYFIKNFKYDYSSENDAQKGTFTYRNHKIYDQTDSTFTSFIKSVHKDSLIFKGENGMNNSVFKKLHDSLKTQHKNILFTGRTFLSKTIENKDLDKISYDTITFVNDSILVKKSDRNKHREIRWERFCQNGFDIIFIEFDLPLLIKKEIDHRIYLSGFHKKAYDIEFTELH